MKTKHILLSAISLVVTLSLSAQSKEFKLGQWVEIHNAILKELNRNYVDSLPVGRIEREGINAMLANLDPYTVYIPQEENEDLQMMINKTYGGIGSIIYKPDVDGNVIINEPYAGSPAAKAGLRAGDEIMEINGESTHGMTASEASDKMKGNPATKVVFKIKKAHTNQIIDVEIMRERIHLPDVEYAGMLDDTTGYVLQAGFTEEVSSDLRKAFTDLRDKGMKKFVLDLRGNGGGLIDEAIKIVSFFVPKGSVAVSQKGSSGEVVYRTTSAPIDTLMPIVVMVDGGSASASEIVAGALQDLDRATIMGKRTYGKGLVQGIRPLPYNGSMKVTVAKYYTPSGRCVQAIDYSKRNEDGSVGYIPDSLTTEFKTRKGRIVRDGGGITPDVDVPLPSYSRLVYSLVYGGIIEQYALSYASSHESIPALEDFHYSDSDYEGFIEYAKGREFDYRSSAMALFDQMKKELEKDGLADHMKEQLAALDKAIEMDKEQFLRLKKDEIIPFIEEEIAVRYYFQQAGIKVRLRYDTQLKEAMTKPLVNL